ncbi:BON1-associated protein 2 [Manihot esculenta]|nr:BON1-associated protein 2 [Manihot esculenta]
MRSTCRTLEITLLSCEDLRIHRKWVKKNTYVMVRTDHLNYCTSKLDTEGGAYPSWNQKLTLDMPVHEPFITLEVHCKTASGDRTIGTARMSSTDFMGGYLPLNYLNFLSYRLRDAKGERNGIINVSVKVIKLPEYMSSDYENKMSENNVCSMMSKSKLIPAVSVDGGKNLGFVTGIPVWGGNHE